MGKSNTEEARVEVILNGQKANATLNEMRAAARALGAELGKIPDPINNADYAAGKKKLDDLKGKINEVTGKANETGFSFKRLGEVAGGVGLASLVEKGFGTVKKVFLDVMNSTEATKDKLEKAFTQVQWGYQSLLRTIATGDWSNMFKNMELAVKKGGEVFDIMDELEKRQRSFDMQDSERQNKIFDLRKKQKDVTTSTLDQAKAGLDIMHLENQGLEEQDKLKRRALDAAKIKASFETGLADFQVVAYQRNYEQNLSLIKTAEKYNALKKEEESLQGKVNAAKDADTRSEFKANLLDVQNQIKNTSATTKVYADIVEKMGKAKPETLDELKTTYANVGLAAVNMKQGAMRSLQAFNSDLKQLTDAQKKENDKYAADYNKHAEYLKKITQDLAIAQAMAVQDEHDRELKMAEVDFQRKLAEITGHSEVENKLREALQQEYNTQVAIINKKYSDEEIKKTIELEKKKWDAKIKGLKEGSTAWFDASISMLQVMREAELANTELTEKQKLEIEERYRQLRKNLIPDKPPEGKIDLTDDSDLRNKLETTKLFLERTHQDTIAARRSLLAEQRDLDIAAATDDTSKIGLIWEKYYADLKKLNLENAEGYLQTAQFIVGMLDQVNQAWSNYENAQLQKDQDANDKKKTNLKQRLDAGKISQKQYDDQILKMDTDMDAKKRKLVHDQAVRQKELMVMNAIIATALGVIQATNTAPPLDIIMPIIIGALGAAQIALILATPVPEAAKGKYDVIGQGDGRSYSADWGGQAKTGIYSKPTLIAEAGPELVVDAATTKNLQMNFPGILDAINFARVPQFAGGNYPNTTATMSQPLVISQRDPELTSAIKEFNINVKKMYPILVFDDIREAFEKVNIIESSASKIN
jgi:hypothetical protein